MAKGNRKVPGINASSTADISFILLIFFLVVTSMSYQTGLNSRLPEKTEDNTPPPKTSAEDLSKSKNNSVKS